MFYQGTLQHGIAAAVQQSKVVVSFVTDDADESKKWEDEFLTDSSISSLLEDRAITLRLEAGSQEAGFLGAIYPLPKTPTLVIMMSNGQLKDYITSGVSKSDFLSRVTRALGEPKPQAAAPSAPATSVSTARPSPAAAAAASGAQAAVEASSESASDAGPSHDQQLAERAARIAAQRQREAEEAAQRRKDKGKAKAEPEPEEADADAAGKPRDQVKSAAQQLRQRQAEARRERERILKQIEHDRTERKRRDEARRAARLEEAQMTAGWEEAAEEEGAAAAAAAATTEPGGVRPSGASSFGSTSQKRHEFCALQVRLLDGSTIRTRLPSSDNIRSDVRKWVDESRGGSDRTPYTLRVIFPNRLIDETEEDRSLEALGLTPSSTLVLVPVAKFSSAYHQNDGDGILGRLIAFVRHFIMMIVTFFTTIFTGAPRDQQQQPEPGASTLRQPSDARQRGDATRLRGQNDAQRDYQLYNGNSLNFEPRPEDNEADTQ